MIPETRDRVVVTGLGAVTPIGATRETFWAAALAGVNGISPLVDKNVPSGKRLYGGEIRDPLFDQQFDRAQQLLLSTPARFALVAAREAMDDAGLTAPETGGPPAGFDPWRLGVSLGSGAGNPIQAGVGALAWKNAGLASVPRRSLWCAPATSITSALSAEFEFRGPNRLFTTSCMAGNNAISAAADLLSAGRADVMLTGGAEVISWVSANGFRMLTTTKDDVLDRSQPFSADRRGVIIGEGAGILVLERFDQARRRGARVYAEVRGSGFASDAHHMSSPHPHGCGGIAAVRQSLERAGVRPDEVDYVSAHGTGSQLNDVVETRILKAVLGDAAYRIPISSIKSMIGHTLGAASAIEAIACVLAIRDGRIPPTINYTTPDPECDLDWVPNVSREHRVRVALSTAFAFGGSCSSIVFGSLDGNGRN